MTHEVSTCVSMLHNSIVEGIQRDLNREEERRFIVRLDIRGIGFLGKRLGWIWDSSLVGA